MTVLDLENRLVTVIVLFKVKEGQQAAVIDRVKQLFAIAKRQPGFVSANLHRSLDGVKAANYAQWEDEASLENFRQLPDAQALVTSLQTLIEEMDSHQYEIVASESKVGTPEIKPGEYFVHFAEFRMPADNQPRMVALAKEHVGPAMSLDGLVSANFHRSLDGVRVINYGQWENESAISKLTQRPGFGKEDGYWTGLAENEFHLYEVVLTENSEA
ncbi:MAG: antibiotic biosynthesis monooxygenase [Leptolyngbya sp. SIO4C1]|nr:antibiotic biosynthesis monooxygenase [Leptolyngbya sp. SIO4C1]